MPLTTVSRAAIIADRMAMLTREMAQLAQELKEIEAQGQRPVPRTATMRPRSEFSRIKGSRIKEQRR